MDSINPRFQKTSAARDPDPQKLAKELLSGSRAALSRAMTLVESTLPRHRRLAETLVQQVLPHSGDSLRVGITGVPGVGKSTFIESFGLQVIDQGKKLAVLAVDPSSTRTRGSILGDKTRMEKLSQREEAFIRPSPAGGSLGGVARKTRESILLCEAAGYDLILVETVGVGQSETTVKSMVDFFMLLMLAGAGDVLQGIKRGIMEMADMLVLNKADKEDPHRLRNAMGEYKRALHLFPPKPNEWVPPVLSGSALEGTGIEQITEELERFERQQKIKGYFEQNRREQALLWFKEALSTMLQERFYEDPRYAEAYSQKEKEVQSGTSEPAAAARSLIEQLWP